MASNHGSTHSEPAKSEQIITELFTKILQIVLESRRPQVYSRNFSREQAVNSSPASSSSSSSCSNIRSRDKWFNLAIRDSPAVLENIEFWRQTNFEPMVIEVLLKDKIIERWVVEYHISKEDCSSSSSSTSSSAAAATASKRCSRKKVNALYRKSILLLRSLYSSVRLLPAYKLFRDVNSSRQISHRVSAFVEPFTRSEESEMQQFLFTPLDTFCGRISLSLLYIQSISETNSDQLMSRLPVAPQLISQYIGSPLLKKFPSLVCSPRPQLPPLSPSNCSGPSVSCSKSDRKPRLAQSSSSINDKQLQECTFGKSSTLLGRYSSVNSSVLSRLFALFEENFDNSEFSGTFLVDGDSTSDSNCNRMRKDAAVGALVQMLNKAPPLGVERPKNRMTSTSEARFLPQKTTTDALEELRRYSDIKHLLRSGNGGGAAAILNPSHIGPGLV